MEVSEEVHDISIHNFVHECVDHTKHILQNLKKTYTPVQVPAVLAHNCDTYMTMFSFDTERGDHVGSPNDNARCAIFTRQLQALFLFTNVCKSLTIGLALVHGRLSIDDAVAAARLEEEYQIAQWGMVEGGHDVDRAHINVQIASGRVLLRSAIAAVAEE